MKIRSLPYIKFRRQGAFWWNKINFDSFFKVFFWWRKQNYWTQTLILPIKFHTSKTWCIYKFYQIQICLINLGFSKFLSWTFSSTSWFFLSVCIFIYELYSIKPSYFTETMINVKIDPKTANTEHSDHLHFLYFNEVHIYIYIYIYIYCDQSLIKSNWGSV